MFGLSFCFPLTRSKVSNRKTLRKRKAKPGKDTMKAAVAFGSPKSAKKTKSGYASEEVASVVTETRVVWECLVSGSPGSTDQYWVAYDSAIQPTLEESYQRKVNSYPFIRGGVRYIADFSRMKQCRADGVYSTERDLRRSSFEVVSQAALRVSTLCDSFDNWLSVPSDSKPFKGKPNIRVYELTRTFIHSTSEVSRDVKEFNFASMQFCRLLNKPPTAVTKVDVIEYDNEAAVLIDYMATRRRFASEEKNTREILVFHGTDEDATGCIISEGFKIGGFDEGVSVKHGRTYGSGVYTATGPSAPIGYGGSGRVILAKALVGDQAPSGITTVDKYDSCSPNNDWMVFKDGRQLLPLFVIHFNPS